MSLGASETVDLQTEVCLYLSVAVICAVYKCPDPRICSLSVLWIAMCRRNLNAGPISKGEEEWRKEVMLQYFIKRNMYCIIGYNFYELKCV